MNSTPPDETNITESRTNAASYQAQGLRVLVLGGIALSLILPEGTSIAPVILMIFGAWTLCRSPRHQCRTGPAMLVLIVCFAAYACGSGAISAAHGDPLGHFEQYIPFLAATLIAVALQTNVFSPNLFIGGFAVAAILAGIASIVQVVGADQIHRACFFTNTNTFGTLGVLYGVICAPAIAWSVNQNSKKWRTLLFFGSMGGIATSLLSGSKGSWLALLVVGPMAFAQATKNLGALVRIKCALAVLTCVIGISLLPNSPVISRVHTFAQEGDIMRQIYWQEGWEMARAKPVLGVGRAQVCHELTEASKRQYGTPSPPEVTGDLHNEYVDILAAKGVLGLALTLSALLIPLALLARSAKALNPLTSDPAVTGILFVVAFAICGLTDVQFQITAKRMIYVFATLIFVHFASTKPTSKQAQE